MAELFADMEKMDIQAERQNTADAKRRAEMAEERADKEAERADRAEAHAEQEAENSIRSGNGRAKGFGHTKADGEKKPGL